MYTIIPIQDLSIPELDDYRCRSEVQLLRRFEPQPGVFVAESPRVIRRALAAGYLPLSFLAEEKAAEGLAELFAACGQIPVYTADERLLRQLTGFPMTQGALCVMRRRPLPPVETVCAGKSRIAVLEQVVNPANVGAIFRCAAALGFDGLLLTEGCCDPLYRRAIRVGMGTVFQIPWTETGQDGVQTVRMLRRMGFAVAAMALREQTVSVDDPALRAEPRLAVLFGTEGEGLRAETIAACDYVVRIPMAHGVDSLNVAAASAIAFWQLGRRATGAERE